MALSGSNLRLPVVASRSAIWLFLLFLLTAIPLLIAGSGAPEESPETIEEAPSILSGKVLRAPADRHLYRRISEIALDLPIERRLELWRASHRMTRHLAPAWPTIQSGFIRGGLLHWPELSPEDRQWVKSEAGRLIEEPEMFQAHWRAIWMATEDIDLFRAHAPKDAATGLVLVRLAMSRGEFDAYRDLREDLPERRERDLQNAASSEEVLRHLVSLEQSATTRRLMEADLRYLEDARPYGKTVDETQLRRFVNYALDAGLQPLRGLTEIAFQEHLLDPPLRARLALALGALSLADRIERFGVASGATGWTRYRADRALFEARRENLLEAHAQLSRIRDEDRENVEVLVARLAVIRAEGKAAEIQSLTRTLLDRYGPASLSRRWTQLCGRELCRGRTTATLFAPEPMTLEIPVRLVETDRVAPWIEIAGNGRVLAEGPVTGDRGFRAPIDEGGLIQLEIRLLNPTARMWGVGRRIELPEASSSDEQLAQTAHEPAKDQVR